MKALRNVSALEMCYSTFTERRFLEKDLQYILVGLHGVIMICIGITNCAVIYAIKSLNLMPFRPSVGIHWSSNSAHSFLHRSEL